MAIEIVPYRAEHIPLVLEFNARLRAGDVPGTFGINNLIRETNVFEERAPGSGLYVEALLAVDDDGVHGGYVLKHQDFQVNGEVRSVAFFQHPLSEGTVDKRYALVGPRLLRDALRRQPLLYALGIGGFGEAAARLLKGGHFEIATVPFRFRVEHAARFLREIRILRSTRLRRLAADVGAATGLGALGIGILQRGRGRAETGPAGIGRAGIGRAGIGRALARRFTVFDVSADEIWEASRGAISFGALRDRSVLAQLYDTEGNVFLKVAVEDSGRPCGWAICLATQVSDHKYFGNLKLGSIVDCLARPGYERRLIDAAADRLREEDVDLIVTNQTFGPLGQGLRGAGFLGGPSNFLLAASPQLAELIGPLGDNLPQFHVNRGDGDGPVNL